MRLKPALGLAALLLLFFLARHHSLNDLMLRIQHLGPWGPPAFIAVYILACVSFAPGAVLTLGAGALFGIFRGTIFVSVGSVLGAVLAFLIGRYLARDWVSRKVAGNPKFQAVSKAVAAQGWKIVLLTRLSPIFPFNLLNYAFSVTEVSLKDYFLASLIGMLPGTILYVSIGSLAGDLTRLGESRARGPMEWTFYALGLAATVFITFSITRIAKQTLDKTVDTKK
jgi:uncharacterized membrane protein YdjX (TVP38/TMEM64 family)